MGWFVPRPTPNRGKLIDALNTELAAWQRTIDTERRQVRWQFFTDEARVKLRHLNPPQESNPPPVLERSLRTRTMEAES
ncbi:hypothetical protein AB0F15_00425 [Amycolatopsis sp. NPDC026612]|uniref:hypothetical protein n=1 Tax=Amycolatopsis sp. NPDC026612 TaxID=3155466 RepID=UPI003406690C